MRTVLRLALNRNHHFGGFFHKETRLFGMPEFETDLCRRVGVKVSEVVRYRPHWQQMSGPRTADEYATVHSQALREAKPPSHVEF